MKSNAHTHTTHNNKDNFHTPTPTSPSRRPAPFAKYRGRDPLAVCSQMGQQPGLLGDNFRGPTKCSTPIFHLFVLTAGCEPNARRPPRCANCSVTSPVRMMLRKLEQMRPNRCKEPSVSFCCDMRRSYGHSHWGKRFVTSFLVLLI